MKKEEILRKSMPENTVVVFKHLSENCPLLSNYVLVGGTALAIHLHHRLSEDLDFFIWKKEGTDVYSQKEIIDYVTADSFLSNFRVEFLSPNHLDFFIKEVKTSFVQDTVTSPFVKKSPFEGFINIASIEELVVMKIEMLFHEERNVYRDYYDLYSISKYGISTQKMISLFRQVHPHFSERSVQYHLTNNNRIFVGENLEYLNPKYQTTTQQIAEHFKTEIRKERGLNN